MKIIDDTRFEGQTSTLVRADLGRIDAEALRVGDLTVIFVTVGDDSTLMSQSVTATDVLHAQKEDGDAVVVVSWSFTDETSRYQTITVEYDPYDKVSVFCAPEHTV